MRIHRHIDAGEFLRHSESWLLESEPENNLILGVARRSRSQRPGDDTDEYWATVFEDGQVVGAAFRTPPYPLSVTRMMPSAVPVLIDDVAEVFEELPGVTGPMAVAESFAAEWRGRYGVTGRVKFKTRVHVLTAVEALSDLPPGSLRQMTQSDEALIRGWMNEFARDAGVSVPPENHVRPLLEQRKFHLWDDSGPRSLVAAGRDTPSGACITTVYTPPAFRRKGYATASVASLSRKLLATGKTFCCLYTDLDNPTSNSIYRKIGYEPVRDDVELEFENR
jgi:hypothetical protein